MDRILQDTEIFQLEAFLAPSENTRMDEETININNKATLFKTKHSLTSICWRSHLLAATIQMLLWVFAQLSTIYNY